MRAVDAWAIDEQGVPSLELMEAAGAAVAEAAARRGARRPGRGSSAARATTAATGWSPPASCARPGTRSRRCCCGRRDELSADATANLERFPMARDEAGAGVGGGARRAPGVVVDAIFGTGFAGAPRDPADAAIEAINGCGAPVVAADIASGRGRVDRRGRRAPRSRPTSPSASTPPSSATGSRRARRHTGELGWPRSAFPPGARSSPRGGADPDRGARAPPPRRAATRPSSLRPGAGRRRLARADRRRLHGRVGGDPGRRRLRDGRRAGRARADLRGQADRGDVGRAARARDGASRRPPATRSSRRPSGAAAVVLGPGARPRDEDRASFARSWRGGSRRRW